MEQGSHGTGFPWSGAPGPRPELPGRGWACRQRHRVAALRTAGRLPAGVWDYPDVVSLHICASGIRNGERAAGRLQHFGCKCWFFSSFLKQVLSRHYKNCIYMILTFYNLLLPLRTWPVWGILKMVCCIHVAWCSRTVSNLALEWDILASSHSPLCMQSESGFLYICTYL